jgi:hypothetical protein
VPAAGPPYSNTLTDYTKKFTATWEASWEKMVWLILEQSPLLWYFYNVGAIHMENAPAARIPFAHGDNPNIQTYQGTEVLNTAESEFYKPFIFDDWGQISCQSVIATDKLDTNKNARDQIVKMLPVELQQAAITMHKFIETQMHTAKVVDGDIDGLRGFLEFATPAYQTATVGNVAKNATYHFNQFEQIAGGFASGGVAAWTKLYRKCARWGRRPDLGLADVSMYDAYEAWCGPERALVDENMGSAGFDNLRFKGMKIVPDYGITEDSGEMFFLNIADRAPTAKSGHNFQAGYLDPIKGQEPG